MGARMRPIWVVLLVLSAFAAVALAQSDAPEPAPNFRAKTTDGERFNNESTKGKVVLLDFWTTWCPYCREEAALVDSLNHEFAAKGLLVLAVDVGESKKKVKKYLEQNPRTSKVVLTEDTNLAAMYQATVYPIYVVIDRDGNVVGTQRGAGGERALRNLLRRAGLRPDEQ
jgi:thiol-disulfide isomerase/thioredoxin